MIVCAAASIGVGLVLSVGREPIAPAGGAILLLIGAVTAVGLILT